MKPILFGLAAIAIVLSSCKKEVDGNDSIIRPGTYTGTFQRQVAGAGTISNLTVTFSTAGWTGESQYAKYPALCHGSYKLNSSHQITFENACAWTAEFDWTLILSGDYKIVVDNNYVEFSKDYAGAFKDIYKLVRQ